MPGEEVFLAHLFAFILNGPEAFRVVLLDEGAHLCAERIVLGGKFQVHCSVGSRPSVLGSVVRERWFRATGPQALAGILRAKRANRNGDAHVKVSFSELFWALGRLRVHCRHVMAYAFDAGFVSCGQMTGRT